MYPVLESRPDLGACPSIFSWVVSSLNQGHEFCSQVKTIFRHMSVHCVLRVLALPFFCREQSRPFMALSVVSDILSNIENASYIYSLTKKCGI